MHVPAPRATPQLVLLAALISLAATAGACVDVRAFAGSWSGEIVAEPAIRQGFTEDTRVAPLVLSNLSNNSVTATLTTSDGRFDNAPVAPIVKAGADVLASMTFDGDPLRNYVLFATLSSEPTTSPATVILSLFADDHVELRAFRGNDLYGVFYLRRRDE